MLDDYGNVNQLYVLNYQVFVYHFFEKKVEYLYPLKNNQGIKRLLINYCTTHESMKEK